MIPQRARYIQTSSPTTDFTFMINIKHLVSSTCFSYITLSISIFDAAERKRASTEFMHGSDIFYYYLFESLFSTLWPLFRQTFNMERYLNVCCRL